MKWRCDIGITKKKLAVVVGTLALITVIGVVAAGAAFAQTAAPTPVPNVAPAQPFGGRGMGRGFGLEGFGPGSWANFDAMAQALNLTPTQLFEALHSGKTLDEIAKTQGVDLAKVQEAANAARIQAMKDTIAQAVKDRKITQQQADWLLQGLEKGYTGKGRGGMFGFGPMGQGGKRGHGNWGGTPAPTAPAPGSSS
jgi:hypothetical protein